MSLFKEYFQEAKTYKQEIDSKIESWLSQYNGEPYGNEVEGRSKIVWKLIKKQSEVLIANLTKPFVTGEKIVNLKPVTKYDVDKAKLDELLINHFYKKEFDYITFHKTLSRVLVKEGTVFIKVEWIREEKKLNINEQKFKRVITNKPYAEVLPNEDVFTDPLAYNLQDSRYLIIRKLVTEEELKNNKLLNQKKIETILNQINSTIETAEDLHNRNLDYLLQEPAEGDKYQKEIFLYELWYKKNGLINVEYYLGDGDDNLVGSEETDLTYYPFINIQLFNNEFSLWGNSLAEMIEDEQKFMTAIIRGVIDNMALSNNGIKFIKKGALDSKNYERLLQGQPVVEINTTSTLRDVMIDGNFNELPSSVYNLLQIIEQQSEGLTGVSRYLQGMAGKDINSPASNFSAAMNQSQVRLLDFLVNVKKGITDLIFMWLKMIYKYLSDEEIYRITGMSLAELKTKETMKLAKQFGLMDDNGEPTVDAETYNKAMLLIAQEVEQIFNKEDVVYDVNIVVGTDGLKAIQTNQINMLLQQIAPLVGSGTVPYDVLSTLMAKLFEIMDYPSLADEIRKYKPQPDPMQQQLEIAKAQTEIEQNKAKAMKEQALAENAIARTEITKVKAQKEALKTEPEVSKEYLEILDKLKEKNDKER